MKKLPIAIILILNTFFLIAQEEQLEQNEITPCSQVLNGDVRDLVTKEFLSDTKVILSRVDGTIIASQTTTVVGTFSFTINCNTQYKLECKHINYTLQEKLFTTNDKRGKILTLKVLLDSGDISFVKDPVVTKKPKALNIEKALTKIKTPTEPVLQTKSKTSEKSQETLAKIEGTKAEELVVQVKKTNELQFTASKPKTPQKVNSSNELVLKPIYFDYESSYLNTKAKSQLQEVAIILKKNPELIIEIASYTDAKGPSKYNKWLSDRRAKRTINYLIKKGINTSRVSGKGHGDSKQMNDCKKDSDCTDEQRAVNRRTEFTIVKK